MHNIPEEKDTRLDRRLGLVAATITGLGVIIGSGIYVIIGIAAGEAGNAVWLSFLFASFGAGLTALSYARLGKLHPKNAPEYHFVNLAFGRLPAFLAGWLILLAQIISASAVALGFAGYLNALTGIPELLAAIGLVLACMLILYLGISQSAVVAIVLTGIEVLGLFIIIAIGIPDYGQVNYFEMPVGILGVLSGASLVFFAFLGFEGLANLSEEMKNPERNLPRAILLALGLSTAFYILVAISAVSVVGWSSLSQTNAPLALVAEQAMGRNAGFILSLISLAATGNTVLILLLAASRITHAMSCAGVFPVSLCRVLKKRRTPWLAIVATGVVSILFISFRSVQQVAEYTNFVTLMAFIGVNASAVILLSRGKSGIYRHVILNKIVPGLGILISLWLAIYLGWRAAVLGAILLAIGFLVYWVIKLLASKKGVDSP